MVLHLTEDNEDLRKLRERYQIFRRSLGSSTTPPVRSFPQPPPQSSGALTRTTRGPGSLTYGEVARVGTQPEGDSSTGRLHGSSTNRIGQRLTPLPLQTHRDLQDAQMA